MKLKHLSILIGVTGLILQASIAKSQDLFEAIFPLPSDCALGGTINYDEETKKVENNLQDEKEHPSPLWTYNGPVEVTELGGNAAEVKIPQPGVFFGAPYTAISIPAGRGNGYDSDYKFYFDATPEQVQSLIKKGSKIKLKIYNQNSTENRPKDDSNLGFLQRTTENTTIYICHSAGDF